MEKFNSIISALIFCLSFNCTLSKCEYNWDVYKDDQFLKIFTGEGLKNYTEAEEFCKERYNAQLVSIEFEEKQKFIENYLKSQNVVDNIWIGLKYVNNGYSWSDKTNFLFSNWAPSNPKDNMDYCVQIKTDNEEYGKWSDVSCNKKNLILCEQLWSMSKLQYEIMKLRKQHQEDQYETMIPLKQHQNEMANLKKKVPDLEENLRRQHQEDHSETTISLKQHQNEMEKLKKKVQDLEEILRKQHKEDHSQTTISLKQHQNEMANLTKKVQGLEENLIPVGFIYVQLPKERSPEKIWSGMIWKDISSDYDSVFFRVIGRNSSSFGTVQEETSPRLIQAKSFLNGTIGEIRNNIYIAANGIFSSPVQIAVEPKTAPVWEYRALQLKVSAAEVRPRNMAIRIWKRIL